MGYDYWGPTVRAMRCGPGGSGWQVELHPWNDQIIRNSLTLSLSGYFMAKRSHGYGPKRSGGRSGVCWLSLGRGSPAC
jgi:hypothetical protein